jgi:hypothetical protein
MDAERLLAEALHDTPWQGDSDYDHGYALGDITHAHGSATDMSWMGVAEAILAASPALRRAIEIGTAWQAAEDALPEGLVFTLQRSTLGKYQARAWVASALRAEVYHARKAKAADGFGASPVEALNNLAALLKAVESEQGGQEPGG